MLKHEDKIEIFEQFLENKNGSYADYMKGEIYFYFFENEGDFSFLDSLATKSQIENKIQLLISKMIMHEHEEGLEAIISYYI